MDSKTTVDELKGLVAKFVKDRDWEKYHNPKDLATAISIEAAELLELFLWENQVPVALGGDLAADAREELADLVIYCLSFANAQGWDISDAVREKVLKNEKKYPVSRYRGVARIG